ncbi:MAG: hypothetical protein EBQ95_01630 [Gammaproteobacteria bacterium]|nr:hypothetical protein [Gammaproteobacteria bacterium]
MPNNYLVLSIDFDGCSDNEHGQNKIISDVQLFIQDQPNISHVLVLIGSLRQSLFLDKYNAIDYSKYHDSALVSCKLIGDVFMTQLRTALPSHLVIEFEPLLTSDIYNHLTPGTTYQAMQTYFSSTMNSSHIVTNQHGQLIDLLMYRHSSKHDDAILQTRELIDFSKISILYMQMQHVAHLMPETPIHFRFYDDRTDIHQKLKNFFQTHTYSMPQNITWHSIRNDSQHPEIPSENMLEKPFQGEGKIEHNYPEILNHVIEACPFDMIDDLINQQILEQTLTQAILKSRTCHIP